MIKTNKNRVVMQSVQGKVHHPQFVGYRVDTDGNPMVIPGTGGISYNVKVGDSAFGWAGDHVEPGVSLNNKDKLESNAMMVFSCIGNEATVVSGEAKGRKGFVTGTHGGIEHVLVYFDQETLEKMTIDDKVLIKGWGQGLQLLDYPEIKMMSLDPDLFEKMAVEEREGKLIVPIAAKIPQTLMGSGVGSGYSQKGDYDLITSDRAMIAELGLDKLRFGDIVLLEDCDNTFGLGARLPGAISIGVVVHSDCIKAGHGPGITILMATKKPIIEGRLDNNSNIADLMGVNY
jgi:hypothetical protein